MKPAVVFIAAFVVATGASTGAKVMMTKPGPAPHEASADSTSASDSTHSDCAAAVKAHAPTARAYCGTPKAPVAQPIYSSKRPAPSAKTDVPAAAVATPGAGKNPRAPTTAAVTPALSPAAQAATDSATQASGASRCKGVHRHGSQAGREGSRAHVRRRHPGHSRLRRPTTGSVDPG